MHIKLGKCSYHRILEDIRVANKVSWGLTYNTKILYADRWIRMTCISLILASLALVSQKNPTSVNLISLILASLILFNSSYTWSMLKTDKWFRTLEYNFIVQDFCFETLDGYHNSTKLDHISRKAKGTK